MHIGPCPPGQVVALGQSGALACLASQCQSNDAGRQLAPFGIGFCYEIGSRGPCPESQYFGFDVFLQTVGCVDIRSPGTVYYTSVEEDAFLDETFNELYPDYSDYRVQLVNRRRNATAKRRQFGLGGIFQVPSSFPEILLNPCRPGERNGNNFKCTNPLV